MYEIISVAGEFTVLLDGTQIFTSATNTVGWPTPSNTVGRIGKGDAGNFVIAYIGGMYLFSAKLTTDRAALITYINARFGLSSS